MKRALLVLVLLLAGLFTWERALATRAHDARAQKSRVGRLISDETRAGLSLSAVRLERRGAGTLTYGRVRGRWRCLDVFLAPADVGALESLVQGLLDAQGFVVSDDTDDAAAYGIGGADAVRVSLCGPQVLEDPSGDVQIAFDLGASVPGQGGAFVRQRGVKEVWAIDSDPRAALEPTSPELPPLLEPYVVPRDWEGWRSGLVRLTVRRTDGPSFVLERRTFDVPPEELRGGRVPWKWILAPGPSERDAARLQAHAFSLFVQRIAYVDVLDPRERDALTGADANELVIECAEGPPLVLRFGNALPDGTTPVWNDDTSTLLAVDAEVLRLVLPDVGLFLEDSDANPWDAWLHR